MHCGGVDMFWIRGGGTIFETLAKYTNWPVLNWWAGQLEHKYWEGFNFEDLIFPMFLFIAGVSLPFSINNRLKLGHTRKQIYLHAFTRLIIFIVLGFLLANGGIPNFDFGNYRYTHVLMRIGIGWFFAAGWSLILLSIFYLIIDVWKLKKWSFFFVVIGSNSIFIYSCQSGVLDFRRMSGFFFKGLINYPSDTSAQAVIASIAYLLVSRLFLYFMYKRKIFVKVKSIWFPYYFQYS